jgi:ATP-dependent Lon protease
MTDQKMSEDFAVSSLPEILPILPLFDNVVFPKMVFPMEVTGDKSIQLIDEAMAKDRFMGLAVSKKSPLESKYQPDDFYYIGTSVVILRMAKSPENKAQLLLRGVERFRIKEFIEGSPYLQARIEPLTTPEVRDIEVEALMSNLVALFDRIVKLSPFLPQEFGTMAKSINEPGTLADMVASIINASIEEKQQILETLDVKERLKEVTRLVNHQVEILELGNKIQSQVKDDMDKSQREYYLRQQLNAIRKELGEEDESKVEIEEYRAKIEKKHLPEEARREAERELERLSRMHPSSAEYTVSSTYLDWITSLPWNDKTEDNLDIKKARRVLDEDHFGLEKAKKRNPTPRAPFSALPAPPAREKPHWAIRSPGLWAGNSSGFPWAASMTKRKSVVIAGPM